MNSSHLFALVIFSNFIEFMALLRSANADESQGELPKKLSTRPTHPIYLSEHPEVTKHFKMHTSKTSAYKDEFNDPLWTKQWYAQDYREVEGPVMDHNLVPVYRMKITGKGVRIVVIDDGVQKNLQDLDDNVNLYNTVNAKYGFGSGQPDEVSPDDRMSEHLAFHTHGTRSAGVIAMKANNYHCGVGVAYNSEISGVKVSGPNLDPSDLAFALNYMPDSQHIYANTWEPLDDGVHFHKMAPEVKEALEQGAKRVRRGRGRKGSIYVFSAGQGRLAEDNCAADEYVNNPYTLAIAGVSQKGEIVTSEHCFGIIASAYSFGWKPIMLHQPEVEDEGFVAAMPGGEGCTRHFGGSATSVSLATGIIALALEAKPNLLYRDVMHLITLSAEVAPLAENKGTWTKNAAGFWFSRDFGFGLLNAENMVLLAREWKNVPKERVCEIKKLLRLLDTKQLSFKSSEEFEMDTNDCEGDPITRLEQVELICTIRYFYRGALAITLTSPQGTKTNILEPRLKDKARKGLREWGLRSLHTWGEDPRGKWRITVAALKEKLGLSSFIDAILLFSKQVTFTKKTRGTKQLVLRLRGTAESPPHLPRLPRTNYAAFRLPDGTTSHPLPAPNPDQS